MAKSIDLSVGAISDTEQYDCALMTKQNFNPWLLTAEGKIKEAMGNGEFANRPRRRQPLNPGNDAHVPPELHLTTITLEFYI